MTGPENQKPEDGDNAHDLAHSLSTTAKKAAAKGIHLAGERLAHALEGGEHDAKAGSHASGSGPAEGSGAARQSDPPSSPGPRQTGRLALLGGVIAGVLTLFGVVAQASSTTKSIGLLTVIVAAAFALVSIWLAFSFFDARRERERQRSRAEARSSGPARPKVSARKAVTTSSSNRHRPDRDSEPRARIRSYIQEIEQGYQDGRGSRREWLVTAPLGYGKTSLQRALKSWAKARGMVPIWVTVSAEAPGAPWHVRCQLRVSGIAKDLGEVDAELGRRLTRAILVAKARIEDETEVGPAMAELSETVSAALISAGTTAFLVDDMHHLGEAEAAWLLDLGRTLIAGSKALVVYASQEPALPVNGRAAVGNPLALATISAAHSRDEAAWWLEGAPKKISPRQLTPIADQVLAETAGLCFIFDWRCQDVADNGPDVLKDAVTEAAAGLTGVAAQAAAAALAALDREAARVAGVDRLPLSDWLAVLDRFGGSYLGGILNEILQEEEGLSKEQAADVAAWLAAGRLEIQAFDDDKNLGLRLIPFLQEYRRGVLRIQEEPRLRHLRAVAERNYWRYIDSDFSEPASTQLTEMVRFETPEWHMLTMEWLDHAQAAGAEVERDVTLSCMQLFLTCYTWWDCFVHYPYCTQLLEEFERRWPQADWVKDFRRFREAFPSGSYTPHARPSIDVARWARTEEILDDLVGKLDLVNGEPQTPAARRVYGLLAQQYAHVYLFLGFHDESLTWLERARENDPEDWQILWLEYRMAEAHYAAGRYDEARRLADKVEADAREMKDNDLTVVIAQIQSDLAWQARDTERSLTYLVRAVIWAHAYHLQQETDGGENPSTPNAYTQARQEEAHQRLSARLAQLDRVARADWTARIATVFEPYWRHVELVRSGRGRGKGLPPRPTWEDIRDGTSGEYFRDVRTVYFKKQSSARSMAQRLTEPLDAPLP